MRNALSFLAVIALAALFGPGCAGPEQKLGRGISNTFEIVRMGEMRRSIEQSEVFDPGTGFTVGLISGFDRSLTRTGLGLYEVVTFPIPSYGPELTSYLSPKPAFPESYKPGRLSDRMFDTDTFTGFSGGDVAPWFPGSRFVVFDN
jgi:putative exosortase-associated protein (TIGR04073 family)